MKLNDINTILPVFFTSKLIITKKPYNTWLKKNKGESIRLIYKKNITLLKGFYKKI